MTTRLAAARLGTFRLAAICGLALSMALHAPAVAQDDESTEQAPAAPVAADAERAHSMMGRLTALYVVASDRPTSVGITRVTGDPEAKAKAIAEHAAKKKEWEASLKAIPELAAAYLAVAGEQPDPSAYFFAGYARTTITTITPSAEVPEIAALAVTDLESYLDRAPRDGTYRTDAQRALVFALLRLARDDPASISKAVPHADAGVRAYLERGQAAEAGSLAHLMLQYLVHADRRADAAKLASSWDVEKADLGPSTDGVRALARRARLRPGEVLTDLPEVESFTGAPMQWSELKGKPFILHFFSTVVSTPTREVETILVPLRDKWKDAGLLLVGCSTDLELSEAEVERKKAEWERWGKVDVLRDGRLASVREWAEQRGMDWPWYWDGKFTKNVLVQKVGVTVSGPYAVLVGKDGKIAWCGAPFEGLSEAVEKLMTK